MVSEKTVPSLKKNPENKGRILRLKSGYNPNSSSIGSDIPTFLALASSAGALTTVLMHLFNEADEKIRGQKNLKDSPLENEREA